MERVREPQGSVPASTSGRSAGREACLAVSQPLARAVGQPRPALLGAAGRKLALLFPEGSHRARHAPVVAIVLA
jgi:hypothetical protein